MRATKRKKRLLALRTLRERSRSVLREGVRRRQSIAGS